MRSECVLMHSQRRLHGSCVSRDGDGILVVGPPGSGNPTLSCDFFRAASNWWRTIRWTSRTASPPAPPHWPGCWRSAAWASCACPTGTQARLALVVELDGTRRPHAAARANIRNWSLPVVRHRRRRGVGPGQSRPGAGLRARAGQPGRGSVRRMSTRLGLRGHRHRPVRRRQGLDPARAGGRRLRSGGQPAADRCWRR